MSSLPKFAIRLLADSPEDRTAGLESVNPVYFRYVSTWRELIDAFEGSGGFLNGEYLWPYTNEDQGDYKKRQKMARYHNYAETIVDLYVRHVFTQAPKRTTKNADLQAWWNDVDGIGTSVTDFLRKGTALALAAGHAGVLMDQTADEPTGPSKADQRARPFVSWYTATAIKDWRMERDEVTAVKLCEATPPGSIVDKLPVGQEAERYLLWDREGWARFSYDGELIDADVTGLDIVPFEVLRPKPSLLYPFIGRSLFGGGSVLKALYNRWSEQDQVLRDQAFSLLTVEVGENGDVKQAREQLGSIMGTSVAVAVQGKIKYEAPDMKIPEGIGANILQIIREIYRAAHMRYERDSLAAESAEAIRLQYTELNEMLSGLAAELQRLELRLARFFFAWTSATPEAADQAYRAADVSVEYPEEFFLGDLKIDLDAWIEAISMDLGDTFTKRIKKRAVRRIDPEIAPEDAKKVDAEIDAQPSMQQQAQTAVGQAASRLGASAQARLSTLMNESNKVPPLAPQGVGA